MVANLGSAAVSGYQSVENMNGKKVIACAKHFVGDGNTEFGTGMNGLVDRGNTILTIDELKEKFEKIMAKIYHKGTSEDSDNTTNAYALLQKIIYLPEEE